jgi:hypothetical protein
MLERKEPELRVEVFIPAVVMEHQPLLTKLTSIKWLNEAVLIVNLKTMS